MAPLDTLWQDLRYALRSLRGSPLLASATVLTLTLGIGMNTGIFTLLNGMILRARVEKEPETFVHLAAQYSGDAPNRLLDGSASVDDFQAYQENARTVTNIAAWGIGRTTIGREDPNTELALLVTCNFFHLYGLDQPRLGRLFRPDECAKPGSAPVVLISEELWRNRFGADPQMLGSVLWLNRQPFTVAGIVPLGFSGRLRGPGIWLPYTKAPLFIGNFDPFRNSSVPWLMVEGRLAPGQSRAAAQSELAVIARRQDALQAGRRTAIILTNGSFIEEPSVRPQLLWLAPLILGALTLVLLLACTNVTMLLLSRAAARQREIAIRLSLGAGRARLLRMLLMESLILAGTAGAISAWITTRLPQVMQKLIPGMPHYPLEPNLMVFGYLAGVTLLAGMMAGTAPAFESLKVDLTGSLKGLEGVFAGKARQRGFLIATQIAMSLVLLAGGGLFVRAQETVFRADPGFETRQVLLVAPRLTSPPYTPASSREFYRRLAQNVRALPGIRSVAFTNAPPLSNDEGGGPTEEVREPSRPKGSGIRAGVVVVSPGYFETMGIAILRGRSFRESESPVTGAASPTVVSEAFARTMWPDRDPMGQPFLDSDGRLLEVEGVARDVKSQRFGAIDGPMFYRLRSPEAYGDTLLARYAGTSAGAEMAVRTLMREMDRELLPVPRTLQETIDNFAALFWRMAVVALSLGVLAVILAVVGIYGVVAFAVTRRTREMGIRMALGASRLSIIRSVILSAARPIVLGLAVGLALSVAGGAVLGQALRQMPFALDVRDPVAYGAVSLLLLFTALAAILGPAWRASRSDPARALRE